MPDHVHLLLRRCDPASDILKFLKSLKQRTGYEYKQETGKQLWQKKSYERRLLELKNSPNASAIPVETLPDYVIAIEGSEPLRIFQDANEDLHETVFVVL